MYQRQPKTALVLRGRIVVAGEWIGPGGPRRLQNGRLVASAARGGFDSHALPPAVCGSPQEYLLYVQVLDFFSMGLNKASSMADVLTH